MLVYHSGFQIIKEPDVTYGRKNADFGQGFYLSDSLDFSLRWSRIRKEEKTYINTYALDLDGLKVIYLKRDPEWFSCIFDNRRLNDHYKEADVVIGPIANDTIFDTLGIITSGFLTAEEALKMLSCGPEYTQITLKSEKAVSHLKWLSCREVSPEEIEEYQSSVKKEQEDYLNEISRILE